jgi:flagellar basal-body rod modification protein FlgD
MITAMTSSHTTDVPNVPTNTPPGGALGKNQFLKLLIAQLQHQDPMNPMQGDQMAAQLAQFSSLEQLQQINATLNDQSTAYGSVLGAIQAGAAMNTIGRTVIAVGDQVQIGGANGATTVTADLAGAGNATIKIYNSAGVEVATQSLGAVAGGRRTFNLGTNVTGLPAGDYTYAIELKDAAGNDVPVQTYTTGKVDGISSGPNGILLNIAGILIPYANVVELR